MKPLMILTILCAFLSACSQGSSGSSSPSGSSPVQTAPIEGTDLTGSYKLSQVLCSDPTGATLTAVANVSNAVSLVISGNSLSETDLGQTCNSSLTGRIVLKDYIIKITERIATNSNSSSCSITYSLTQVSGPNITPTSVSYSVTHQTPLSDIQSSGYQLQGQGILLYNPNFQVTGRPSDVCYMNFKP